MPLVAQAFNWIHGVYMAATMGSETTAAAAGTARPGAARPVRDAAFLRLQHGRLLQALAEDAARLSSGRRRFSSVNWFRKDAEGKFVWPGFGENMRVLRWIIERSGGGTAHAQRTALGYVPEFDDLNWRGLEFGKDKFSNVLSIDKAAWQQELAMHDELFKKLEGFVPQELAQSRRALQDRLAA